MGDSKSDRRVIVAVLLTSTLLTMLAISGLIVASANLSNRPIPEDLEPEQVLLLEALGTNPLRRPFAAANVVVSSLVLFGSFMLSWRRQLAFWWIRQAVAAKVLWIIANTVSVAYHLRVVYPRMHPDVVTGDAAIVLGAASLSLVGLAVFSIALHLGAAWRATRPDIRAFVEGAARS